MSSEARAIWEPVITSDCLYLSSYTSCALGPSRILPLFPHPVPLERVPWEEVGAGETPWKAPSLFPRLRTRCARPCGPVAGGTVRWCHRVSGGGRIPGWALAAVRLPAAAGSSRRPGARARVCAPALRLTPFGAARPGLRQRTQSARLAAGRQEAEAAGVSRRYGPGGLEGVRPVAVRL